VDQEQAMTELKAAARTFRRAQERADAAHTRMVQAMRTAADAGAKQVDIVRETGYTREHVRRLLKD
jgi:CRP-like cAMP-binding protein